MDKQTIQIAITANLDYSALVRHVASEVFENARFSKAWCGRLKLVVDELFMNAVKYGSTKDKSVVHISFEFDKDSVQFTIEDDGTGPKAKSAEALKEIIQKNEANNDLTRTSGRGLALIAKMWTDGMQVAQSTYGGIGIGFLKKLENAEQPPATPALDLSMLSPEVPVVAPLRVEPMVAPVGAMPIASQKPSPSAAGPKPQGKIYEVKLSGEIDQSNMTEKVAPVNDQIATMESGSTLSLDFSDLTYINSTFIGNLAGWYRILQKKQGSLRLKHVNESVKEILTLVGLINVIEISE
jgi:stage II sporulation protein AA (anti-sigma F factor antagonist)